MDQYTILIDVLSFYLILFNQQIYIKSVNIANRRNFWHLNNDIFFIYIVEAKALKRTHYPKLKFLFSLSSLTEPSQTQGQPRSATLICNKKKK